MQGDREGLMGRIAFLVGSQSFGKLRSRNCLPAEGDDRLEKRQRWIAELAGVPRLWNSSSASSCSTSRRTCSTVFGGL